MLPPELTEGSNLRDKEYAWELADFPQALQRAPDLGYACLGGQFWFLISEVSLYEPFWLGVNASDKMAGADWSAYARRSCEEVLTRFNRCLLETDFREAAGKCSAPRRLIGPMRFIGCLTHPSSLRKSFSHSVWVAEIRLNTA